MLFGHQPIGRSCTSSYQHPAPCHLHRGGFASASPYQRRDAMWRDGIHLHAVACQISCGGASDDSCLGDTGLCTHIANVYKYSQLTGWSQLKEEVYANERNKSKQIMLLLLHPFLAKISKATISKVLLNNGTVMLSMASLIYKYECIVFCRA